MSTVNSNTNELLALREENERLLSALAAVENVLRFGARMDLHPTRMGGSSETMKEAAWWQSWLLNFDKSWRDQLKEAVALADHEPVPEEFRLKVIEAILSETTLEEWINGQSELAAKILDALAEGSS